MSLPEWPKPHPDYGMDWRAHSAAALARLRAGKPYMRHHFECNVYMYSPPPDAPCSCGLDRLLADLLPGEGR